MITKLTREQVLAAYNDGRPLTGLDKRSTNEATIWEGTWQEE